MGRAPCCEKVGLNRGPWTTEEDRILIDYINQNGHGNWRKLPKKAGLLRCGKSCRLRWINYLRPDLKRGDFSIEEENTLIKLHQELGNKWSAIAKLMPGRTDNEIKNVWNTHLKKKLDQTISSSETKKRSRKRTKIEKASTENDQDSRIEKSTNNHGVEKALELIKNGDQNSSNNMKSSDGNSSSVSMASNNYYNEGPSRSSSSSTTTAISDSLNKLLGIEDDFSWSDVIMSSANLSQDIIPSSFDGNLIDEDMEFWYNIYTTDGCIEDYLLQDP